MPIARLTDTEDDMGMPEDLEKLKALRDQGALTEEEFILAKKRVIDGDPEPRVRFETPPPRPAAPPPSTSALRQFHRSRTNRWIGGVCGGLDDATDIPAWTWRILFVLLTCLHGVGAVLYIVMWIFVPLERLALPGPSVIVPPAPPSPPSAGPTAAAAAAGSSVSTTTSSQG